MNFNGRIFRVNLVRRTSRTIHRLDGSSTTIRSDGSEFWSVGGALHREDSPAIIYADGVRLWYRRGQLHRNNLLHRIGGPAIIWGDQPGIYGQTEEWWENGIRREPPPSGLRAARR